MITRALTPKITALLKSVPAVTILGPRQVGKTTLARVLSKSINKETLFIDLEKHRDRNMLYDIDTFFEENKNKCIIIDEVQTMPEVFTALRPAIDDYRKNGRFILLGSASPKLVKGVSETLAGRISYTHLMPFGLMEVYPKVTMNKHWFRGGFPRSVLARTEAESAKWIDDFIETYIHRDLSFIFNAEINHRTIRFLWSMIASSHGNIWNAHEFARALGVSAPTVIRYLDFLEAAYLVRVLYPYHANVSKRLVKAPKIYIRDSGILHRLCDIYSMAELKKHKLIGASWEGYVIEEICKNLPSNIVPLYYRTHSGAECDLVLVKGTKILACIEIKISNTPNVSRGFYETIEDLKPMKAYIVTPSAPTYKIKANATVMGLVDFLKIEFK